MQNKPHFHARRIGLWLAALLSLGFLTGCEEVKITNLTPTTLPENPSQIYTISARITTRTSGLVAGSVSPQVVIDGKQFPMQPSALGANIWDLEYQTTAGRTEMAYYILVGYQVEYNGALSQREAYTGINRVNISGRYVLSLGANRGPVGARISVLGRGFSPQDVIYLDNIPARTSYESPSSISFFVPAVEPGRNYRVQVSGATGSDPVGTFRVDASNLTVFPSTLTLRSGESQTLTFTVPNPAPAGGLLLDVTTDVPESVIMPEVVLPSGSTTVTVTVQGGSAGQGSLFLKGFGGGEVAVPITVQ